MTENDIVLIGVKQTLKALEEFDKQSVKAFNKVLTTELKNAKKDAQGFVTAEPPLSGWRTVPAAKPRTRGGAGWPSWDQSIIRQGITSTRAEGKPRRDYTTSAGALKNRSAAGVIYEIAGRKNRVGNFISNLERKQGDASRLIWKSVDKNRPQMQRKIADAFAEVVRKIQNYKTV